MVWKECYLHVAFAISSVVLMFLNFIGGLSFLLVKRYEKEEKLEEFVTKIKEVRSSLNFVYLILSFLFMTVALILGILRAKATWKTFFDFKTFVTLFIVFYLLFATSITFYRRIKKKSWRQHLAYFSIFSLPLIILSLISNFLSAHHKYLKLILRF